MQLIVRPINEDDARAMLLWHYSEPYTFYNWAGADPEADVRYFLEPVNHFHVLTNEADVLIGFCSFGEDAQVPGGDYSLDALDVGLGMAPTWVGQGLGNSFLAAILAFAQESFAPIVFRATIVEFNQHSQRIFANAGFRPVQRFLTTSAPFSDPLVEFVVVLKEL